MILEDLNHISYVYIAVFCSETSNRSFVFPIGFFSQNGRMLTSSDLDQRPAKFGSASNSSEWCFLLKFGRCRIATLMNHAIFLHILRFSTSSVVHSLLLQNSANDSTT